MLVVGFPTGPLRANCYLIATASGRDCVVVDPGQESEEAINEALSIHGLRPVHILLTHGHRDHSATAPSLAQRYEIPVYIHPDDRGLLAEQEPDFADVAEFQEVAFNHANLRITVISTPGHTPGSVTFLFDNPEGAKLALTGDALFSGSIGRSDFPGGSADQLEKSLCQLMMCLPEETVILPGHGSASTIGIERGNNPFLASLLIKP